MKSLLALSLIAGSLFLTACETRVVDRRHHQDRYYDRHSYRADEVYVAPRRYGTTYVAPRPYAAPRPRGGYYATPDERVDVNINVRR